MKRMWRFCRRIGDLGAALLPEGSSVLTHCNAGALATAGYGTAGGVIRSGFRVWACARGLRGRDRGLFCRGARLTAWELSRDGIPVVLITDNMAAHCMSLGRIDAIIVGADRVAANGDVANKIGTYGLAVARQGAWGAPFTWRRRRAPSTWRRKGGADIPIERAPRRGGSLLRRSTRRARGRACPLTPRSM